MKMTLKIDIAVAVFFLFSSVLYFTATDAARTGREGQDVFQIIAAARVGAPLPDAPQPSPENPPRYASNLGRY